MVEHTTVTRVREKVYEYRKSILRLCCEKKGLHIGGDLSCAEVLVSLYQYQLNIDPQNPDWPDRDRFVLSKGHGGASLYIAMAQRGFFDCSELFETYKGYETRFGMHPCKAVFPMLDSSSGSLGHGLPIAVGMAMAAKLDGKSYRTYCLIGDGESNEGSIWEAALSAPQWKLGNLVAIMDRNRMCLDGFTEDILRLDNMAEKWRAFNWNVVEIDGNDVKTVLNTLDALPSAESDVPTIIIANTTKGKGVSFMENNPLYHHNAINGEQLREALAEVETAYEEAKKGEEV